MSEIDKISEDKIIKKIKDDKYYTYEELTIILNYIDKLKEENRELQIELGKYQYDAIKALEDDFVFYPKQELDITEELDKATKQIRNDINLAKGAEGFESEVLCDKDDLILILNTIEELQVKLNNSVSKDEIKEILLNKIRYRQFELQQEYKDFKDDIELNALQDVLELLNKENKAKYSLCKEA